MSNPKRRWTGQALEDLLTLPLDEIATKYGVSRNYAKTQRCRVKKLIKTRVSMEQPTGYEASGNNESEKLDAIRQLLERSNINFDTVDRVTRVNVWQGFIKNSEGEIETVDLASAQYIPKPDAENHLLRQAAPTNIRPSRSKAKPRNYTLLASIPDIQVGYRNINGELVPIHDERAIRVARLILADKKPDIIVDQGDGMDLSELSKYEPDSVHFVNTLQAAIDRRHQIYAELRADNPNSDIYEIDSNHIARLGKFILKNTPQLAQIRRAGRKDEWPIISYPSMLRLDELGVKWISGYPAAHYEYKDDLIFIHGKEVRSGGSTAEMYSKKYPDTNVVFGHVHRQESHTRTTRAGHYLTAITFGTLAKTDGHVPSYHNAVNDHNQVVKVQENWQQGLGLIYDYGDGNYQFDTIRIKDGKAFYNGKEYRADE